MKRVLEKGYILTEKGSENIAFLSLFESRIC